ncbi:hypothetical protein EV424DRAFT_589810 [Suillus variegatus]|nr:hypothetical protein EV424DRAFT_589810 [Suillus variegatus]
MLVPPKSGDLLASLDPTKARPRQFVRSAPPSCDTSLWTETPAERQQRLATKLLDGNDVQQIHHHRRTRVAQQGDGMKISAEELRSTHARLVVQPL